MDYLDISITYRWNRKILSVYWILLALNPFMGLLFGYLGAAGGGLDNGLTIGIPLFLNSFVMLLAEVIFYVRKLVHPVFIILVGTIISTITVAFHTDTSTVLFLFFLPLLISIFYFYKPYTIVAAFSCNVAVLLLYIVLPSFRSNTTWDSLLNFAATMIGGTLLIFLIINRVRQLMNHLAVALEAKRELLVQSIIMDKMVKTDQLTGLYNHRAFHDYLEKLIEQHTREPFPLHLALIDVDSFKHINDSCGHRAGDFILIQLSTLITQLIGPHDFAARTGGEEFAILFLERTAEQVYETVELIRQTIASLPHPDFPEITVTVSIGLQEYLPHMNKDEFFKETDDYMYLAKNNGKNRTVWAIKRSAIRD